MRAVVDKPKLYDTVSASQCNYPISYNCRFQTDRKAVGEPNEVTGKLINHLKGGNTNMVYQSSPADLGCNGQVLGSNLFV